MSFWFEFVHGDFIKDEDMKSELHFIKNLSCCYFAANVLGDYSNCG